MDLLALERLLANKSRPQRQRLAEITSEWRSALEAMADEDLLFALSAIRRTINSKKLRADCDRLIGELRRDDYGGGAPLPKPSYTPKPAPPVAPALAPARESVTLGEHSAELIAQVAKDPRGREPYLVYRDWLESRGLVEDGRVELGVLADADDMLSEVDWHLGFIRRCRLSYSFERFNGERPELSLEDALVALLDDPGPGRFVQELTLGMARHDDNDYSPACGAIGRRLRPALEKLEIGDFMVEECELNWTTIGDASPLWSALPRLRELSLRAGSMGLEGIDLPALRKLETETGGLPPASLAAIANAKWPELRLLSLQIGTSREGAATDVDLVGPLLGGHELPKLEHLGLRNCEFTDELCALLPMAPILPRLRSIDLSMGTMTMVGVDALCRRPEAFAHLESLDVDDNYLPPEARARLEQLGCRINFGYQREDEGYGLYASAFE